jgi:hypothetical protein
MLINPETNGTGTMVLDELYSAGIMVIMTVDDGVNNMVRVQEVVSFFKNHPAVLMWSLGSEWNINRYFGAASSVSAAAARTESAAKLIKSLDTNHPVATSYGDIDINTSELRLADTQYYVNTVCPSVDVWSLNIYRGRTLGTLFEQWGSLTTKPMFLGEFGIDTFHATALTNPAPGAVNEQEQAEWDLSLWNDLFRNLSANNTAKVALGGAVFEFNDEWWKVEPWGSQQTGGWFSGGFPDGMGNEEYFGIVTIDRQPRQAYDVLGKAFDPAYAPPPERISFKAVSRGASAAEYAGQYGVARFLKSGSIFYQKTGGGGGGRGFNVAVIDPDSGAVIEPGKNFDTWYTRSDGSAMNQLIAYLNSIPNGRLILLSVADEAGLNAYDACNRWPYSWVGAALQTLEALGSTQIRNYCYRDSWAAIVVKGEGTFRSEQLGKAAEASAEVILGACAYSIIPANRSHPSRAQNGSVTVLADPTCSWSAMSNDSWITITSGTSGAGIGTVVYSVAVNTGISSRTGMLTIAGRTFTVNQAGSLNVSSGSGDFNGDGKPDILWRNSMTGEVVVWIMDGTRRLNVISLATMPDPNWRIVGVADFNSDGKPDILWRNLATGANAVWFLSGTTLVRGADLEPVSALNWRIAGIADFNGDGKPDILWCNTATGELFVWFMSGITRSAGYSVALVKDLNWKIVGTVDLDSDGEPDILWRNSSTGQNAVWYMNGTTLLSGADLQAVTDPNWKIVAVADFDSDGRPDILWRNSATGENFVWYMHGIARISGANLDGIPETNWLIGDLTGGLPQWSKFFGSDFNGDGKPDILWMNASTGQILVWFMDKTTYVGSASLGAMSDPNWRIVATADLNSDGNPDILWRNSSTGEISVWFMNGTTFISRASLESVPDLNWRIVGVADFNSDGKPDILWRNFSTGDIAIWFMNGTSRTSASYLSTVKDLNWKIVGVADFNSDGKPDILWRNSSTGANYLWFMNGASRIGEASLDSVSDTNCKIVALADFNADGKPDILWRNSSTGANLVWLLNGSSHISDTFLDSVPDSNWLIWDLTGELSHQAKIIGCDFNGDGKPDIVWRNSATGEILVWFMNNTNYLGFASIGTVPDLAWKIVGFADFNGDGKTDILWRNSSTGQNYLWLMNGISRIGEASLDAVPNTNWKIVAVADFNSDGKPDILWRNSSTGDISVWLTNGTSYTSDSYLYTVTDQNWKILAAGDFNSDGKPDILWRNTATGANYVWFMNGTTRTAESWIETVGDLNWKLVGIVDFNADRKPDLLWRNAVNGDNYIWFMNGITQTSASYLDTVKDQTWQMMPQGY